MQFMLNYWDSESFNLVNKRQRIPKGQSKMDNPEKLATQSTKDEEKLNKNTIFVGHHYT